MARNQVRSTQRRVLTAVIQGVCGVLAVACGIALIPLRGDERYMPWQVQNLSTTVANGGFGIWGGVIILVTAVLGSIYREKKAMISIYAAFSLASMVVAVMLFIIAIFGIARFAEVTESSCRYLSYSSSRYEDVCQDHPCCCDRSRCPSGGYYMTYWWYTSTAPMTDPYSNYDTAECETIRGTAREMAAMAEEECRDAVRSGRRANISVYAVLLLVSVIEFVVSVTAAVLSFVEICRECCQKSDQQVVYLAYPANGQSGSVPMVLLPSMGPGPPQMTGGAPNTLTSPCPPQMAVMNPSTAPGLYPYPMPAEPPGYDLGQHGVCVVTNNAMAADAKQREATSPQRFEAESGNKHDG